MAQTELKFFINHAPLAMAMFDREMRYLAASPRWLRDHRHAEAAIGRSIYDVAPDLPERWKNVHQRALSGEILGEEEDRIEHADGRVEWIRWEARPWLGADGRIGGIVIFTEQITQRKEAEEARRESEERYRYAIEAANDGIWDCNLQTGRTIVSPAYLQMLGYAASDLAPDINSIWIDLLHPDDRARVVAAVRKRALDPGNWRFEFRLRAKDGSYRWILGRGKVVERDSSGAPIRAVGTHVDITERKEAEKALLNSQKQLRLALDAASMGTFVWRIAEDRVETDERLLRLLRLSPSPGFELAHMIEALHPDDRDRFRAAFHRAADPKNGGTLREDVSVLAPDGARWIAVTGQTYFEGGQPKELIGAAVDITERKCIEQALRDSEERMRFALEASHTGAWWLDLTTMEAQRSVEHDRIFGYETPLPEWTYETFLAHIIEEDRKDVETRFRESMNDTKDWSFECRIRRADGAIRWIWVAGHHQHDANGSPKRMIGITQDVTDRKLAEQALLQRSEDRYQRIVEAAQEGIWVIDAQGFTTFANAKMCELLGYSAQEMQGRHLLEFVDDQWRLEATRKLAERAAGAVEKHDFKFRRKDGSDLWALLGCYPIFEGGQYVGALAMVTDNTERRRLQQQIQQHLEALKLSGRRKDEFLAMLAHELRNPLVPIANALQLLQMPDSDERSAKEENRLALQMATRQVKHLRRLVDDLLEVTRISLGKIKLRKEPVDLTTLVPHAVEVCQPEIQAKVHKLRMDFPAHPLIVDGDPVRLTQVFANIINNAVKYTNMGGEIEIVAAAKGRQAVVTIRDNGIGIAPEMLGAIFEIFTQVDFGSRKSQGGIGIGLALARSLVSLHGGRVEAQSEGIGRGSAFTVRLPLAPDGGLMCATAEQEADDMSPGTAVF